MAAIADLIDQADKVASFGGDGCEFAPDQVKALALKTKAPVGFIFKGKQWLEHDNPHAVGMTGLLGYGGSHQPDPARVRRRDPRRTRRRRIVLRGYRDSVHLGRPAHPIRARPAVVRFLL